MNTLDLAKQLIGYKTVSPVKDPEAFNFIKGVLEAEGIEATLHESNGVYSLTAETGNGDAPRICFNGHVDVVEAGNGWDVAEPFTPVVTDGKLYGRGAADMKSGLAAQINAFIDLHHDPDFDGHVTLMVVGDEEIGGFDGTERLVDQFPAFDYAIVGEPTDYNIQVGARGVYWVDVYVEGETVHASRPYLVDNIVEQVPDVVQALTEMDLTYEHDGDLPEPTAPVTTVQTSGPQNSIPEEVRIGLDIRYVPGQTQEQVRDDIRDALAPLDIDYRLEFIDHGGAFKLQDDRFKEIATETVTEVMGRTPQHITDGGSSDGRFFAENGTPYIELGPNQEPAHQTDEHCRVAGLDELRESYTKVARRLARKTATASQ